MIKNRELTAMFCSRRCKNHHRGETYIERMVRVALDELGISYQQEYTIGRGKGQKRNHFYSIDFYLPDSSIALEVDGSYWHQNKQEHDRERDTWLATKGITTIRITDEELKQQSPQAVVFSKLLRG